MIVWLLALAVLIGLAWLGLQIPAAPYPNTAGATPVLETKPLPNNLPAPVEGFYRAVYGDRIPIIHSAVLSGQATIQPIPGGPRFPARFRFTHRVGQDYRHEIEVTWFGLRIMQVNETYIHGRSRQELPWGTVDNAPQANQAANLGMWAETMSMPAAYLMDSRVRWEAVDDLTAWLVVPFGSTEERFLVRFDADTKLIRFMEVMRYKGTGANAPKILWITENLPEPTVDAAGVRLPAIGTATWLDDGKPWARFVTESITYNVNVGEQLEARAR